MKLNLSMKPGAQSPGPRSVYDGTHKVELVHLGDRPDRSLPDRLAEAMRANIPGPECEVLVHPYLKLRDGQWYVYGEYLGRWSLEEILDNADEAARILKAEFDTPVTA